MDKDVKCSLCMDTRKVIKFAKRVIGYTLADGETEATTIDEHWEDCPVCAKTVAQVDRGKNG